MARGWWTAAGLALAGCGAVRATPADGPRLTHGVAVGEVSERGAVFWGRCDRASRLHLRTGGGATGTVEVDAAGDFAGTIALDGLPANQVVTYSLWCGPESDPPPEPERVASGSFATAPPAGEAAARLRLVWGGDVGGQNVCRDAREGYAVFERVRERQPTAFIALGDMIYADDACTEVGLYGNAQIAGPPPSTAVVESFRAHWRYNRADPALQDLLRSTSMLAVWDDHEIANDAGPHHDEASYAPGSHRMGPARQAFLDYQPLPRGGVLYRSVRWGRHVEIFLLDTRSYRSPNSAADTADAPKTMLGASQREWLTRAVAASEATWKIVVSSVPISIPTSGPVRGYDGWANFDTDKGFERELSGLLSGWRDAGVRNVVFVTTDVHFASGLRYEPFADFSFLEFVSGPLNAGMFPKQELDGSLNPRRLFLYGPPEPTRVRGIDQARRYFNFGELEVGSDGILRVRIVNGDGEVVFEESYAAR